MVGRGSVRAGFPGLPRLPGAPPRISRPNGKRGRSLAGFQSNFSAEQRSVLLLIR